MKINRDQRGGYQTWPAAAPSKPMKRSSFTYIDFRIRLQTPIRKLHSFLILRLHSHFIVPGKFQFQTLAGRWDARDRLKFSLQLR